MKRFTIKSVLVACTFLSLACVQKENVLTSTTDNHSPQKNELPMLKITVNGVTFSAKLFDNPTTQAFLNQLPLTLKMTELHGNEKYYNPKNNEKLPIQNAKSGLIQAGDLMVWDSNQRSLVLFYKTFESPYKYVRIAHIENVEKLAETLGNKDVEVKFEVGDE